MRLNRKIFFLAALSGVLLFLSFPKFGVGVLAWVALVPLMLALKDRGITEGMIIGFIAGFICHVGLIYWITYVVVHYGHLPVYVGIAAMLLLSAYLSLYTAFFAAGIVFFDKRNVSPVIAAPVIWTALEYAKSHLLTGFPWENLAYSQYLNHFLVQMADITGLFGVSFLIVLINVILHDVIATRFKGKRIISEVITGCVIVILIFGYGIWRVAQFNQLMAQAESIPVSLAQGNIEQDVKWDPQYQQETLAIYKTLSSQAWPEGNGLIVWPETAAPFYFQDKDDLHRQILDIPKKSGHWLLLGSPSYRKEGGEISFLNSAFLLSPEGNIAGQYDKVHLVPYGEYVPLRTLFPFIGKLVAGIGDFQSGQGYYPLPMQGMRLGVLICYEGILPEAARFYKKRGTTLLVNITNDAWFGNTSAPYQHLSMATFRAIETRLYLVRAANTGITAVIDPTGRIVSQTELYARTLLKSTAKLIDEKTFYGAYGDIFVYLCIGSIPFIYWFSPKKGRNRHDRRTERKPRRASEKD